MMDCETLWCKLVKLKSNDVINRLKLIYTNFISMKVRQGIAEWLENSLLKVIDMSPADMNFEKMTQKFQCELINEIMKQANKMNEIDNIPTKTRLLEVVRTYQHMTSIDLYSRFADIFKRELQLIKDYETGNYAVYVSESREIDEKIEFITSQLNIMKNTEMIQWKRNFENYQEEYFINNSLNMFHNGYSSPSQVIEKELHMSSVNHLFEFLSAHAPQLTVNFQTFANDCNQLIEEIIKNFIKPWKFHQQKFGYNEFKINGADLDKLQSWYSDIAQILFLIDENLNLINEQHKQVAFGGDNFKSSLRSLIEFVKNSLIKLMTSSVIIEMQPPQVIKTNSKFSATIRLLIGNLFNNKLNHAHVKASILSEAQAKHSLNNADADITCGELLNNQIKLEMNDHSKQFVGYFRNMMIKQFKRVGKKSTNLVTDEKFGILFRVILNLNGMEVMEEILSRPIVVIVHGSQEVNALATVFWDNSFAQKDRAPYYVVDSVSWKEFAEAISYKFESLAGRRLSNEHLHFLGEKFFNQNFPEGIPIDRTVRFFDFCKENLPTREFSFWEWFYAALKLTKDFLKNAWIENQIIGFIDKRKAENLLTPYQHGTFILRFSDSELSAISAVWVNRKEFIPKVFHIQPINYEEFKKTSLAKRMHQMEDLIYIYPDIIKSHAFSAEQSQFTPCDYIRCLTVMRIEMRRDL